MVLHFTVVDLTTFYFRTEPVAIASRQLYVHHNRDDKNIIDKKMASSTARLLDSNPLHFSADNLFVTLSQFASLSFGCVRC
jgi:hypothetical protein